ncbi:MAG: bacteriohemerythrin [Patescibacteria group bacterium]
MSNYFKWEDNYTFNIAEIDAQHRHFVSILDSIYGSIINSAPKKEQGILLDSLVEYAVLHFKTEENYFDKFNYSGSNEHKEEHRKLKEKVLAFQKNFNEGQKDISIELIDFLEDWLIDHLMVMDKKYVDFFHEKGLK